MPLYMDIHSVPGVKSKDVAEAHRQDLIHQDEFGCTCMTYWIDEERETIFCLIEAENRDAVKEMHRKAHGLVPHKIIEVSSNTVRSFLGRIYDPDDAVTENGIKVFTSSGFRVLVVSGIKDLILLRHKLGEQKAMDLINRHNQIFRSNIALHDGSEVEHPGEGFIISFESANKAVSCVVDIYKGLSTGEFNDLKFTLALNGGEPVESSGNLFGDTVQFGKYLRSVSKSEKIGLARKVKDIASIELFQKHKDLFNLLSKTDEELIIQLCSTLEEHFHKTEFDIPQFSQLMAMSQTQLYRKCVSLTGHSTNNLIKEYRLGKAKNMLREGRHSISQVTFDTGFSSPSYFTKCFKTRYGLLPMEYVDLLRSV